MDVNAQARAAYEQIVDLGYRLAALLPSLALAVAVLLLFWWMSRHVGNRRRLYERLSPNRLVQDLLRRTVKGVVMLTGVVLALEILDATAMVGTVLGAAGIVGIAVGFAFKDIVENYVASVLLSVRHPFGPGDHVAIGAHEGKVLRLTPRATILITSEGNHLRIPNSDVFKGTILNYTTNPRRRFQFTIGVGVDVGLTRAREMAFTVLDEMDGVIADPPPSVLIDQLGDAAVNLVCRGWVDQREADFGKVRSEAIRRVMERFAAEGISMPESTHRVEMVEAGTPPVRSEAVRADSERAGDISVDRHLDDQIAVEREGVEDLLKDGQALE